MRRRRTRIAGITSPKHAIRRARKAASAVRMFYITLAAFWMIPFAFLSLAFLALDHEPALDAETGLLALAGAIMGLLVVGAIRVMREPMLWSMLIAVMSTVGAVLTLSPLWILGACGGWAAVKVVKPVATMVRQNPELLLASDGR